MAKKRTTVVPYNFGGFLQDNAGAIGSGLGTLAGTLFGAPQIGGAIGGAIGGQLQTDPQAEMLAKQQQQQAIQQSLQGSQNANGIFQLGGDLNNNLTQFNGLEHPQGGIPLGNTGNEVEDGETRSKDFIFSDKLKPKGSDKTFADQSKKIDKKYTGMDNDSIALDSKNKELDTLAKEQEQLKADKFQRSVSRLQKSNPEQFQQAFQNQNQQGATHTMPDGTVMPGATHEEGLKLQEQGQFRHGGKMQYQTGGFLDNNNLPVDGIVKPPLQKAINPINQSPYNVNNFLPSGINQNINQNITPLQNTSNPNTYQQGDQFSTNSFGTSEQDVINDFSSNNSFKVNPGIVNSNLSNINQRVPRLGDSDYGTNYNSDQRIKEINEKLNNTQQLTNQVNNLDLSQGAPNVSNYDPTKLGDLLQNTLGADFVVDDLAIDPNFVRQIPDRFSPDDMEAFKEFYKSLPENKGKEFQGTYDDIINNVINKAVQGADEGTTGEIAPIFRFGTNQTTLPSLITFLEARDKNKTNQNRRNDLVDPIPIRGLELNADSEKIDLAGATGIKQQQTIGSIQGETRPFVGDYVTAGLSALPNIGTGIASGILGRNLKYDRANAEQFDPNFVDPTRAIQESRDQFAGAKDVIRQGSSGTGNLLSNLIGTTASQSKAQSGIQSRYDNINAGIANQADQFNAQQRQRVGLFNTQISTQETQDRIGLQQNAISNIGAGLNTGIGNLIQSKRDADILNITGGENFYFERVGPVGNQIPVRVTSAYGYETFKIPSKPTQFRDPRTKETISKKQADKRRKEFRKDGTKK